MPEAWRIVRESRAATAFTGEGAFRMGGRWNSRGVAVIYASSSKSLAALETLVHLNPPMPFRYLAFPIQFETALVERLSHKLLPADWRAEPPSGASKSIGDAWARERRSVLLELPSVIISGESNYLLNPAHPDFRKVHVGPAELFAFDPRLLG
jgi:RES domain-containing protein